MALALPVGGVRPGRLWTGAATSPSQRAGIRVELNLEAFNRALQQFAARFQGDLAKLILTHALDLQKRVQRRTPVDTGRLRNSIHTVPPNTGQDAFRYSDNEGHSFDGSLRDTPTTGPYEAIVGTGVEYALAIEAGHSKQAPAGMFAVTLKEKEAALYQAIERLLRRTWDES